MPSWKCRSRLAWRKFFNPRWQEKARERRQRQAAPPPLEHRPRYPRVTLEILSALSDEMLVRALHDSAQSLLPEKPLITAADLEKLPPGLAAIFLLHTLETEVLTGGFDLFLTDFHALASPAIQAAAYVQQTELARCIADATSAFAQGRSTTKYTILFGRLASGGSLDCLLVPYIRQHPAAFTSDAPKKSQ